MRLSTTTLARASAEAAVADAGALGASPSSPPARSSPSCSPAPSRRSTASSAIPTRSVGRDLLQQRLDMPQKANEVVIVRSTQATATDPAFRAAVLALQRDINALGPAVVDGAVSAFQGGDKTLISADGRTAIIPVVMAGDLTQAEKNIDKVHEIVHARRRQGRVRHAGHRRGEHQQRLQPDRRDGPAQGRGHRRAHRARHPADRVRRRGRRRAAHRPQPHRDHDGRRPDGARRPDVRRLRVRHQHGEHDGPGHGHRLLPVHHLPLPRGEGARARQARRDRRHGRHRQPRGAVQRPHRGAGAARPADRAHEHLRQPRHRRHPRGEHVGDRRADAAAGRPRPPRRPRQQPQDPVPRPAHPRQPRGRAHLLDRQGGVPGDEAAGDLAGRRGRRPAAARLPRPRHEDRRLGRQHVPQRLREQAGLRGARAAVLGRRREPGADRRGRRRRPRRPSRRP